MIPPAITPALLFLDVEGSDEGSAEGSAVVFVDVVVGEREKRDERSGSANPDVGALSVAPP